MQISCSRVGALVYTIRTKPCRWSIDLMTTTDTQENLQKNSWRSSFSSLTPSTSCKLLQNYNLGKTFSSSTGSCLHIGTYRFLEWNFLWSQLSRTFFLMISEQQFAWLCTWDCCNSVLRDLWKLFMNFFLFNSIMFIRSWACTSQTCIMCWSWILAWRWSSHYNL
jgi:hypothetical protein